MKTFDPLAFDPVRCRQEALQLHDQLTRGSPLPERDGILPFLRARPHLSAACGLFNPTVLPADPTELAPVVKRFANQGPSLPRLPTPPGSPRW
jgi:hypothetical protein